MIYKYQSGKAKFLEFDDISIGDSIVIDHLITQEDVNTFASLTGDYNPLHMEKEFAERTNFQKPVVHGMISASFISTIIGMSMPGAGALWMAQNIEFHAPAFVGDHIYISGKVIQKSISTRVIILETIVKNQNNHTLISGTAKVKLLTIKSEKNKMETTSSATVLVTGGATGIGASTAKMLAQKGYQVVINYLNSSEAAEQVVNDIKKGGGESTAFRADVADLNEVKSLFENIKEVYGNVSEIVHCAAQNSKLKPFNELDWEAINHQISIQVKGAYNCMKVFLPKMIENKHGSIVFIGSIATDDAPPANQTDYIVAKSALTSLAKCLAVENGHKGIRINIVAPGMTETAMISTYPERAKMMVQMQTPLRKLASPDEIASVIAFLLSPDARHITGETIRVCGGSTML